MKLITGLIILAVLYSCSTTKQVKKEENVKSQTEYNFELSLDTKLFLEDLNKEQGEQNIDELKLTKEFTDKYNISGSPGAYDISGLIKINEQYNENDLAKLNINTNSKVNEIVTVIIPLGSIDSFLELDGIKYFELTKKGVPKN